MLFLTPAVHAQTYDLTAISRGSYIQTGVFGTGMAGDPFGNFITGVHEDSEYRSFFVFVLPDLGDITGALMHGRFDLGSPLATAWELARAWPNAELVVIPDSGHMGSDAYRTKILETTDRFATAPT